MKLLIGSSKSKFSYLSEFGNELKNLGVDNKIVLDSEIMPISRKIRKTLQKKKEFEEILRECKPDAVFVDQQTKFALRALDANLPLFVQLKGDYWQEAEAYKKTLFKYPPKRQTLWLMNRIAEKCFQGALVIFPVCKYLDNIVKEKYPHKNTEVLYPGINKKYWLPQKGMNLNHPCVGIIQNATIWEKTKEMLILPKILEDLSHVTFYWAGDGPYLDRVLPILKKYDNFKWLGNLNYPEKIREFLTEIDVYALFSGLDMTPLSLLEAQMMEKPVVATRVGGIPEIMKEGETGLLVEKKDTQGWISKLSEIISDSKKTRTMGSSARSFVNDNFTMEESAKKFISISKKCL